MCGMSAQTNPVRVQVPKSSGRKTRSVVWVLETRADFWKLEKVERDPDPGSVQLQNSAVNLGPDRLFWDKVSDVLASSAFEGSCTLGTVLCFGTV